MGDQKQKYLEGILAEAKTIVHANIDVNDSILTDKILFQPSTILNQGGYDADLSSPQYDTIKIYSTDKSEVFYDDDKVHTMLGIDLSRKNAYLVSVIHELFECIAHKSKLGHYVEEMPELYESNHDYACRMELRCLDFLIANSGYIDKAEFNLRKQARLCSMRN